MSHSYLVKKNVNFFNSIGVISDGDKYFSIFMNENKDFFDQCISSMMDEIKTTFKDRLLSTTNYDIYEFNGNRIIQKISPNPSVPIVYIKGGMGFQTIGEFFSRFDTEYEYKKYVPLTADYDIDIAILSDDNLNPFRKFLYIKNNIKNEQGEYIPLLTDANEAEYKNLTSNYNMYAPENPKTPPKFTHREYKLLEEETVNQEKLIKKIRDEEMDHNLDNFNNSIKKDVSSLYESSNFGSVYKAYKYMNQDDETYSKKEYEIHKKYVYNDFNDRIMYQFIEKNSMLR